MVPARLERARRLVATRDYRRVAKTARRLSSARFVLLVAERRGPGTSRIGITVGRRVGNAVERNRVKRRVREWFRAAAADLPADLDLVVIARTGAPLLTQQQAVEELDRLALEATR